MGEHTIEPAAWGGWPEQTSDEMDDEAFAAAIERARREQLADLIDLTEVQQRQVA